MPVEEVRRGDLFLRAPGRQGPRRRHRVSRLLRSGRVDAHRRVAAGREGRGRAADRRDGERRRRAARHGDRGRRRHRAVPARGARRARAGLPAADPAPGRPRSRAYSCPSCSRSPRLPRSAGSSPARVAGHVRLDAPAARLGRDDRRAGRRLPLRAGPGDARGDSRRHGARRQPRAAHHRRRDPRAQPGPRHDRARQDRHVTTGELSVTDVWGAPGEDRERCSRSPPAPRPAPSTPWPRRSSTPRVRAVSRSPLPRLPLAPRPGCARAAGGRLGGVGRTPEQAEPSAPRATAPTPPAVLDEWEASGRTAVVVVRDERPLGALALADTIKPESAAAIAGLQRDGDRRRDAHRRQLARRARGRRGRSASARAGGRQPRARSSPRSPACSTRAARGDGRRRRQRRRRPRPGRPRDRDGHRRRRGDRGGRHQRASPATCAASRARCASRARPTRSCCRTSAGRSATT